MSGVLPRQELTADERRQLAREVLAFLDAWKPIPALVVNQGRDGTPRMRLMGVRNQGFRLYALSIKPSSKLDELAADPSVAVLWYRYDADPYEYAGPDVRTPEQQSQGVPAPAAQPLRLVEIRGTATLLPDAASIRAMPGDTQIGPLADAEIEARYAGIRIEPRLVRVEGFRPGPRFPVYLDPALGDAVREG